MWEDVGNSDIFGEQGERRETGIEESRNKNWGKKGKKKKPSGDLKIKDRKICPVR